MSQHLTIEEVQTIADGESAPSVHLRDCAQCASAVVSAMQMKQLVRDAMRGDPAPPRVAQAILPALRRRDRLRHTSWVAAAAAIAAIVIGSLMLTRQQNPGALDELADMHATILASANPVDVISTDKHTVKPWFEGHVPFAVPVPDLASTPFHLIGGRVVYWHGNQAAYILVGKSAHRISVFVFRDAAAPARFGTPPDSVSTMEWQQDGLRLVAVGDVPRADLALLHDAFTR